MAPEASLVDLGARQHGTTSMLTGGFWVSRLTDFSRILEIACIRFEHALGKASLGLRVQLGDYAAFSAGVQIPNASGSSDYAGIAQVELVYP